MFFNKNYLLFVNCQSTIILSWFFFNFYHLFFSQNKKKESKKSGADDHFPLLSPSRSSIPHVEGEKKIKTLMPKTKPQTLLKEDETIVTADAAAEAVTTVTTSTPSNNSNTNLHSLSTVQSQHGSNNLNRCTTVIPSASKLSTDITPIVGGSSGKFLLFIN